MDVGYEVQSASSVHVNVNVNVNVNVRKIVSIEER